MNAAPVYNGHDAKNTLHGEDRNGFSNLYKQYYTPIFFFIEKIIGDATQAEDITADCFIKLWQQAQQREVHDVRGFLFIAARNSSLDHLKRDRIHHQKEKEIYYLSKQESKTAFAAAEIKAEVLQSVYDEIEKLPAKAKEIFKLSFIEGLKNAEIAKMLDLSEQTIYNQKAIALKSLRTVFKDKGWGWVLLFGKVVSGEW